LPKKPVDGLKAYNTQIASAIKEGRKVGLNEINFDGLLAWAKGVSNAIGNDNIDQQNALSLQNPLVLRIKERNPRMPIGGIYNAAVKYFNKKGMDLQTLPQSQYPTPEQVRKLNKQFGAHYSNASEPLQREIERNHAKDGRHPLNSEATAVYTAGNIAPPGTSSGQHTDVKATDGSSFPEDYLDNYVVVGDREYGMVPLSQVGVTDTQAGHRARVPASHGIDYGTYAGDKIYLKNGAYVVSRTPTKWGDLVKFKIPNDKRTFQFLHGTAIMVGNQ